MTAMTLYEEDGVDPFPAHIKRLTRPVQPLICRRCSRPLIKKHRKGYICGKCVSADNRNTPEKRAQLRRANQRYYYSKRRKVTGVRIPRTVLFDLTNDLRQPFEDWRIAKGLSRREAVIALVAMSLKQASKV